MRVFSLKVFLLLLVVLLTNPLVGGNVTKKEKEIKLQDLKDLKCPLDKFCHYSEKQELSDNTNKNLRRHLSTKNHWPYKECRSCHELVSGDRHACYGPQDEKKVQRKATDYKISKEDKEYFERVIWPYVKNGGKEFNLI